MSEQNKFENEWKNTFEGAELTPSKSVWPNVRADISARQAQKQSSLVVYWRWMVAASVALLMGVGIGSFYYYQIMMDNYQMLSQQEQKLLQNIALLEEEKCKIDELNIEADRANLSSLATVEGAPILDDKKATNKELNIDQRLTIDQRSSNEKNVMEEEQILLLATADKKIDSASDGANDVVSKETSNILAVDEPQTSFEDVATTMIGEEEGKHNAIENIERINIGLLAEVNISIEPQKVPDMMEIIKMQNDKKQDFHKMWAGLSVGGGSFDSNINGRKSNTLALSDNRVELFNDDGPSILNVLVANESNVESSTLINDQVVNQSNVESPAFSYTISADFGKQIGRRTYVQGGVEYNRYSSGATSSLVTNSSNNDSQVFLRYENSEAINKGTLTFTEPYQLTNNYEYVAVPLKFGYQVLNRKIGVSLSSGVSTNFFLKNTLKDKSGKINDVKVTNGDSSPYKPLNFNGLFGAEISYQWNEHYQLAIVPDYRFSLDGLTKSDAFFQSNPTAFFLGFRFKYILK